MKGYIKDYRKELKSDVWLMPPLYHRVWQYLKYMVNHEPKKIPMKDGSFLEIKAGQHLTSIRNIAREVGWYERGVFREPNPKTISSILDWLEKQQMISIERGNGNRQYTLITLINWDLYQGQSFEGNSSETVKTQLYQGFHEEKFNEGNSKETERKQSMDINKNDKNDKNEKNNKDYTPKIKDLLAAFSKTIPNFVELNKKYWDVIRETRTTGKIAESVIYNTMMKWEKYNPVVVEYALTAHIINHAGKREEYTIGIMRRTDVHEARRGLIKLKNKGGGKLASNQPIAEEPQYDYGF